MSTPPQKNPCATTGYAVFIMMEVALDLGPVAADPPGGVVDVVAEGEYAGGRGRGGGSAGVGGFVGPPIAKQHCGDAVRTIALHHSVLLTNVFRYSACEHVMGTPRTEIFLVGSITSRLVGQKGGQSRRGLVPEQPQKEIASTGY